MGKCRSVGGMVEVLFTVTTADIGASIVENIHEGSREIIFVVRDSEYQVFDCGGG